VAASTRHGAGGSGGQQAAAAATTPVATTPPPPPRRLSPEEAKREKDAADVGVARKLFWGGVALLPWLWIVSLLYHRQRMLDAAAPLALRQCECLRVPRARVLRGSVLSQRSCLPLCWLFTWHARTLSSRASWLQT
jgi:hypothetical protein